MLQLHQVCQVCCVKGFIFLRLFSGTSIVACAITGRNCVAVDRNPVCCKGMVFRMASLADLPGPSIECGQRIVENDNADDASSGEESEPVGFRTRLGVSGYYEVLPPGGAGQASAAGASSSAGGSAAGAAGGSAGSAAGASGEATAAAAGASGEATASAGGAAEPGAAASAAEAAQDDDFDEEA